MAKNGFEETVSSLFHGLDQVMSAKTVVGEPQIIGDTIILPLVDVSFGMGAGAFGKEKSDSSGGGIGGKVTPSAVLIIKDGSTRLINVRNQDTVMKLIDMVPDVANKVVSMIKGDDPEVKEAVKEELKSESVREEI
ncbi:MAG: GerW family sporulation protein [Eubacteriales bacterium]|nr:GerW family sporulation protein [Eubacteriales bacterium]